MGGSQTSRIAVLTAVLLVAFGGVSFGGIDVGAGRGGGAGAWRWTGERSRGCQTVHREIHTGYHETFRAEGHVDVDVEQAPGVTLGAAAGYLITDTQSQSAVWDLDDNDSWQLTASSDRSTVRQRYWLGLRVGWQNRFVQLRGMVGLARLHSTNLLDPDVHLVLRWKVGLGWIGKVAYRNRFEWFGGPTATLAHEFNIFHGALFFGGDAPGFEVGGRFGRTPKGTVDPRLEVRLVSASHWRVQPWIRGNVDLADPRAHWSADAGITVLFGRRARWSERFVPPPRPKEPRYRPDNEPRWEDEGGWED